MHLRNGEHGYGGVTKLLHWMTVAALIGQFAVGLTMSGDDDGADRAADRFRSELDRREEIAEARGEAAEEAFDEERKRLEDEFRDSEDERDDDEYVGNAFSDVVTLDFPAGGVSKPEWHVLLGLSIILLALIRLLWRRATSLPAWADHLSDGERTLEARLEKALLTMLLAVPVTGLVLVAGDDDWLPFHVTAQIVLLAAISLHVGLVLKHTVVRRHRHLSRML